MVYILKSIILTILFLILTGALAGGAYWGYPQYLRLQELEAAAGVMAKEKEKAEQQAATAAGEVEAGAKKIVDLEQKAREYDAAKVALSSGVAITILESAVKTAKVPTAEHYLAIGAVRLLVNGNADKEAAAAYERALKMANWPSSMKLSCAAQAGIAATGRQVEIPSDCARVLGNAEAAAGAPTSTVAPAGVDAAKDAPAEKR